MSSGEPAYLSLHPQLAKAGLGAQINQDPLPYFKGLLIRRNQTHSSLANINDIGEKPAATGIAIVI
jgi:hypothetical protein